MYIRKIALFLLLFFTIVDSSCQEDFTSTEKFRRKNNVHLEILGQGWLYNFNYERLVLNTDRTKTFISVGVGAILPMFWFPTSITQLVSYKSHHLSLAIGATPLFDFSWSGTDYTGRIGYRYQKPNGRFLYEIGYTPWYRPYQKYGDKLHLQRRPNEFFAYNSLISLKFGITF